MVGRCAALALGLACIGFAGTAEAATVTTTADSGTGSLRDAIAASTTGETIDFSPSLSGQTITLTSGQLAIAHDLTITGPGSASLAISGNDNSRIFDITAGTVTISGLTVTHGKFTGGGPGGGGGGVYVAGGSLTLDGVALTHNAVTITNNTFDNGGGGVQNFFGTLAIKSSVITDNSVTVGAGNTGGADGGGGVYNSVNGGVATIIDSTVSNNTVTSAASTGGSGGGGIFNEGNGVTLLRSTVADNTVSATSGDNNGGGGIKDVNGSSWTNSTITGNTATVDSTKSRSGGGGLYTVGENPTLTNSTVSNNSTAGIGGGIFNGAQLSNLTLNNTIFDSNSAGVAGANCGGPSAITSNGHNIESASTCALNALAGDQPDTSPHLGPLAGNGGPTQTEALLAGSPAIGAADPTACPATDQRGLPREQVGTCDIGAFEFQVAAPNASTGAATAVALQSATLNGSAVANKGPTQAHFDIGTTTAYGSSTANQPIGSGTTAQAVAAIVGNLAPGTLYHYRLVATNVAGTTRGGDQTFMTASAPVPVTPARVSGLSATSRRFRISTGPQLLQVARKRPPVGTTFRFSLDRAAAVRLDFTQTLAGRRVGRKCVAQTGRNKRRRRCTRVVRRGSLGLAGHAGLNSARFRGWLSRTRKLKPGKYTLVVTAVTPGVGSTSKTLQFTIVK